VFLLIIIPLPTGGTASAQATGINDRGSISGFYMDSAKVNHGFPIAKGTFFTLDFPELPPPRHSALNNEDDVVGAYTDAAGHTHGFIFDDGFFQSVDDPNGSAPH